MSHLDQLQDAFQAYLVGDAATESFTPYVVDDAKVGAHQRVSIYYNAYRLRIVEALTTSYPNLRALLGDDLFEKHALSYIDAFPSRYRNMRWVGDKMSAHLSLVLPEHPVAAEMAAFEWALTLAFDAEDAPVLNLTDLAEIPPEDWAELRFKFHPSMHILPLQYNVIEVWQALSAEESPPSVVEVNMPCLVWRQSFDSYFRSLEADEHQAIQQIIEGATFAELCEDLQRTFSEEEATLKAAQYLSGWLSDSLMTAFY